MLAKQRTLVQEVALSGKGIHSGKPVDVVLKPAEAGSGITFIRSDLSGAPAIRLGTLDVVYGGSTGRYSALKKDDVVIFTVEHLLSALAGFGIDNVVIDINAEEPPGLDGSAKEYTDAIEKAGVKDLDLDKEYLEIKEPIMVSHNGATVSILPSEEFKVSYALEYAHPMLRKTCSMTITQESFLKELASCRTFCLLEEAEAVKAQGLGQGANYDNTMVFGPDGVVENTLHFDDEPARHKILDCVGDFYLLGLPIKGHVISYKGGHNLNRELLKKIVEQKGRYASKREATSFRYTPGGEIDVQGIMKVLPHRYPFLLVDRILELETGKRAVGIKNVTMNEAFFQGHFPQRPVMPGVLMVEAMAQVSGVCVLTNPDLRGKLAFFMAVDKVKFRKVVEPGDQLVMEIELIKARARIASVHGTCKVDGQVVCEADMTFAFGD